MSFIVTTNRRRITPATEPTDYSVISRVAVGTLEEVNAIIEPMCPEDCRWHGCYRIPESGGTVGPLPDGTLIEVERV